MATIMDLPTEILPLIFILCDEDDLIDSVQHVCHRWKDIICSTLVWGHRTLRLNSERHTEMMNKTQFLTFLKRVAVSCNVDKDWSFLSDLVYAKCKDIDRLTLNITTSPDSYPRADFKEIRLDRSLRLSSFAKLTYLHINMDYIPGLLPCIISCENVSDIFPVFLQTLVIQGFFTKSNFVLDVLKSCRYIRHLVVSLGKTDVPYDGYDKGAVQDGFGVPGAHNLRTLNLQGISELRIRNVDRFQNLTYIRMCYFTLNDAPDATFLKDPRPNLKHLDLSHSNFYIPNICSAIASLFPNLESLLMISCDIDDNGFLDIISNLRKLRYLDMQMNDITARHSNLIPQLLPDLKYLNISGYIIEPKKVFSGLRQMPDLTLFATLMAYTDPVTGDVDRQIFDRLFK